jgi:DNA polymerase-3 subunit delta
MLLRPEALPASLDRKLAPLYAIHGDEPLLVLEAADAVRAAARKQGYAEREVLFAGKGFDWSSLRSAGANLSLFGGRKVIDLRLPTGKPGTDGAATIEACCAKPNPDNLLLVTLPLMDRKAQATAWFGALAAAGVVVEVQKTERARLPEWIGARLAANGQRAARDVLEFLGDRVEGNLLAAHQEVQKLALLAPRGELSMEAVEAAVANVARFDPPAASAALLAGDLARYARVLDGLRGEGEAETYVLWVISEDLRALSRIQDGLAASRPLDQLLRENRIWRPREPAFRKALQRVSRPMLRAALSRCALIDRTIKGIARGAPWDEFLKLGLEFADGR